MKYYNKKKKKYYQNLVTFGDNLSKYINQKTNILQKKGHEKMTFMIIPHTQKSIFSLELTKFNVFFSISIFIIIILNSILSRYTDNDIKNEIVTLHSTDKSFDNERNIYVNKLEQIEDLSEQLEDKIIVALEPIVENGNFRSIAFPKNDDVNTLAKEIIKRESYLFYEKVNELSKKKKESGFSFGDLQNSLIKEFEENKITSSFEYDDEIVHYRLLYLNLKQTVTGIHNTYNFLKEYEEVSNSLPYSWPTIGGRISSKYGVRYSPFGFIKEYHPGIDIAQVEGTPVYAAADGYVTLAQYGTTGYGRNIRLWHRFGYETLYGHLSVISVNSGQTVKKWQEIGRIGTTGRSTGPHLHFEVKINSSRVDPYPYLKSM